jgi:hypothetical protein
MLWRWHLAGNAPFGTVIWHWLLAQLLRLQSASTAMPSGLCSRYEVAGCSVDVDFLPLLQPGFEPTLKGSEGFECCHSIEYIW